MTEAEFRLAKAFAIRRPFGPAAPVGGPRRVAALALAGDWVGVRRFCDIAAACQELLSRARD